ncbi:MAG: hypothetical protein GY811_09200 [Myxococcales bacterium]|nr:hypothetical protein [Myxococcales bacterium]
MRNRPTNATPTELVALDIVGLEEQRYLLITDPGTEIDISLSTSDAIDLEIVQISPGMVDDEDGG